MCSQREEGMVGSESQTSKKLIIKLSWEFINDTLGDASLVQLFIQIVMNCISKPTMPRYLE